MSTRITVKADFGCRQGKIRRLNGVNLAPRLRRIGEKFDINNKFRDLNSPISRFHDAPLDNPGTRLVDPNLIFANFHADVNDPLNYYFRQTDDYLCNCRDLGTDIHYRLGPSIDHSPGKYFVRPPEDFNKWVDVCANIIRHYNEGWNNGFAWGIRYWTVWEEPENRCLWAGEPAQFFQLFKLAVSRLKKRFPEIKLGTCIGNHLPAEWTGAFLSFCRDEKIDMDFFAWSLYKGDMEEVTGYPEKIRKLLAGYGFENIELHIGEWNYTNPELGHSSKAANEHPEGCYGYDAAAFAASALTGWQDTPLTMANYYTASCLMGLFDRWDQPKKMYFGFKAFGEITRYSNRVKAVSEDSSAKVLAGVDDRGEGAALISAFKSDSEKVKITIENADFAGVEVFCVDSSLNFENVNYRQEDDGILLEKSPGSAVFLLKGLKCRID